MKKTTSQILIGTMLFATPFLVGASDSRIRNEESTSTRQAMIQQKIELKKDKIENRIEVKQGKIEDMKEKASSTRERIEDRRDDKRENLRKIAQNRFEKIIKRFEMTIQREENIMNRIMSRVEKVKSNGGQTADAEKYIGEAKVNFEEAKVALTLLKNATSSPDILVDANTATSTKIKTALDKIKNMAKDVEKNIREGHESLTKAVKSLRGSSSVNATTTTSN